MNNPDDKIFTGEWYSQFNEEQLEFLRKQSMLVRNLQNEKKELLQELKKQGKQAKKPRDEEPLRVV
jgi:hypothetical protein